MCGATVYILRCADGNFYTGVTRRPLEQRVSEHNADLVEGYTFGRRPVVVIHAESRERVDEAVGAERRIKAWSREEGRLYAG